MTEKELKKLNRRQLLELLLKETEQNELLRAEIDALKGKLQSRVLLETKAGSIAEAALRLNGVFGSAQAAADQYLRNVEQLGERQKQLNEQTAREAEKNARRMIRAADMYCEQQKAEAERVLAEARALYRYLNEQRKKLESKGNTGHI